MAKGFSGECLCEAVRFNSSADPHVVGHCHCVDCRKSSGTGHCTHLVVPEAEFTVTDVVTFYDRAADSGNIVSRGFCGKCGSPIYSKNAAMPGVVFPRASVLDDPNVIQPQMIVYASRAPSWDHMNPALPAFAIMPEGGPQAVEAGKRTP